VQVNKCILLLLEKLVNQFNEGNSPNT